MKKLFVFIITLLIVMNTMMCVTFATDEQHVCEYVGGSYSKPGQCECGNTEKGYVLPKSDTNLDYWIYEAVSLPPTDIDDFYPIEYDLEGWYVNSNKYPILSNGTPISCVKYFITTDSTLNGHVEKIIITDPEVYFDGISLKSSLDEFKAYAIRHGLQIREVWSNTVIAQTGYYSIEFSHEKIEIDYTPNIILRDLKLLDHVLRTQKKK